MDKLQFAQTTARAVEDRCWLAGACHVVYDVNRQQFEIYATDVPLPAWACVVLTVNDLTVGNMDKLTFAQRIADIYYSDAIFECIREKIYRFIETVEADCLQII